MGTVTELKTYYTSSNGYKPPGGNGKMHHWHSNCVLVLRPLSILTIQ
ncbi:hypothetical protein SAMN05216327_107255 [Dyadobacter sp. SG02]|nr:hypothetical protein SAMN05216327_107255 [Dyadobacter sp. SG02]